MLVDMDLIERPKFSFPEWWPNVPREESYYASYEVEKEPTFELETIDRLWAMAGSDEMDQAYAEFSGEPVSRRIRLGVYYNPDYDWFEIV